MFKRWVEITVLVLVTTSGLAFWSVDRQSTRPVSALSHEERIVVLEILDRIEMKYPELRGPSKNYRAVVSDLNREVVLDLRILDSDTLTQEQSLVRLIGR